MITPGNQDKKGTKRLFSVENLYYFYNKDTTHHFHTSLPHLDGSSHEWMNQFGRSVEIVRPVLLHARDEMNDEENVKIVIHALSKYRGIKCLQSTNGNIFLKI
jgi:hypothetical protein